MIHDITLTYGGLSVPIRNWRGSDLPRSRKIFINESAYAVSGNLIKSGTSFELPYLWTIAADLYEGDYDKIKMIWELLDYSRRNQRPEIAIDVNVTSNLFSSPLHPYQNGDIVTATTTGTLPAPLVSTRDYWVVERATNSFKLSETAGGAAIDITSTGSNSVLNTQLFVRLDDESEEIADKGTQTKTAVTGTTPRVLNGGVYYYARFLADWVAPPEFGKWGVSAKTGLKVRPVAFVMQDTGVKI